MNFRRARPGPANFSAPDSLAEKVPVVPGWCRPEKRMDTGSGTFYTFFIAINR